MSDVSFYRTELRVWQIELSDDNEAFLQRVAEYISQKNAELTMAEYQVAMLEHKLRELEDNR